MSSDGLNLDKEVYIVGTLDLSTHSIKISKSKIVTSTLLKMQNEEGLIEVRVRPMRYTRSDDQNRYYWGVVVQCIKNFLKETQGEEYSSEQVHIINKKAILGDYLTEQKFADPLTGEMVTAYVEAKGTSKMSTKVFYDFVEQVRALWHRNGCKAIPDPRPKGQGNFLEDFDELYDD